MARNAASISRRFDRQGTAATHLAGGHAVRPWSRGAFRRATTSSPCRAERRLPPPPPRFDVDRGELAGVHTRAIGSRWMGQHIQHRGPCDQSSSDNRPILTWRDRAGRKTGEITEHGEYWQVSLSPDGRFVAVLKTSPDQWRVFHLDGLPAGGTCWRPFSDADHAQSFAWSHDSSMLIYSDKRQEKLFHHMGRS